MTPKKDSGKKSDLVNEILFEHKWSTPDSLAKGGFSSESVIRFSSLQISKENIFQKTILSLRFKSSGWYILTTNFCGLLRGAEL